MRNVIAVVCVFALFSCQDRVICPAFQSTYILDDSTRKAYFSYVWQLDENTRNEFLASNRSQSNPQDSLQAGIVDQPKTDYYAYAGEKVVPWRVPNRTKYGIQKKVPYLVKNYRLRTAPMENVLAPEPISNDFVASDFYDSLSSDSTAIALDSLGGNNVAEKEGPRYRFKYDPSDNFNVEQEYYNKYFGDKFIKKERPKLATQPTDSLSNQIAPDSLQTKEPFFKRLFKKKKKGKAEETDLVDDPSIEESPAEEIEEEENGN